MKYCSHCGAGVVTRIPAGDDRPRAVCGRCGTIHYENPKVVAGCIPWWEDQVLLCRRAIEPRFGLWTFPAGFMEIGETTVEAAERETLEEANARVAVEDLLCLFNIPHISQVYLVYRARLLDLDVGPGRESLEVQMLREETIPWGEMAFPVVAETLRVYFEDRRNKAFRLHHGDIRTRI